MVIGILSAGILIGVAIGILIKFILDSVFGRDTKVVRELQAENERLREKLKEYETSG
jgi:uncharacterized membrane-anchored protein YhcB (DUF1043 family)